MSDRFVNPYNFIPLADKKSKSYEVSESEKLYTGAITYSLTTKTPLIIPATNNSSAFIKNSKGDNLLNESEHKSYDFYSYDKSSQGEKRDEIYAEPVIPGSEIRGMLRSIYEVLTDSCMSILNEDLPITKRTSEVFKAGLLKREGNDIVLYAAENAIYRPGNDFSKKYFRLEKRSEGSKVYFDLKQAKRVGVNGRPISPLIKQLADDIRENCTKEGYLIKGETGPETGKKDKEKHNCHVFYLKENAKMIDAFHKKDKDRLLATISSYQNQDGHKNDYKEYEEKFLSFYNNASEGTCFPVYYSVVENAGSKETKNRTVYFSPAAITKELAENSVATRANEWVPCKTADVLCPTCDLFGMVGTGGEAKASNIRVADAYLKTNCADYSELYENVTTLQALNGPKISNSEFYLKKPTKYATFWTYDYYIENGEIHFYKPDEIIIRGRKFYWHQPEMKIQCFEPDKMNVTVRPLKKAVEFGGKVYFERITQKQLNQLAFILNCGENGEYDYKMGMAKPLGYGSVHTKVESVELRCIVSDENGLEYSVEPYETQNTYEDNGFSKTAKESFEIMMSFDVLKGREVTYPITENQRQGEEGFKWFTEQNHCKLDKDGNRVSGMRNSRMQEVLDRALPNVTAGGEYSLPKKLRDTPQTISKTSAPANHKAGHKCEHPGCNEITGTNPKNNKPFRYCRKHIPKK